VFNKGTETTKAQSPALHTQCKVKHASNARSKTCLEREKERFNL